MWTFGTITNHSHDPLWISYYIDPDASTTAADLGTALGRAELSIGHRGTIYLRSEDTPDDGEDGTVTIEGSFGTRHWTSTSPATLDVLVNEDSSFTLTDHGATIVTGTLMSPAELGRASAIQLGNLPPNTP